MAFVIDPAEPASAELKRIAGEQLGSAISALHASESKSIEAAAHSVRKSCKRTRALLRMARSELGKEYERSNRSIRDASALLSPLRDAHAVLATFDNLTAARPDLFTPTEFGGVRAALAGRAAAHSDAATTRDTFDAAARMLAATASRLSERRLKIEVGDLVDGAAAYHALARRAFRRALRDASDERLHEWRKRAKDNWYHTQLLSPLAPSALGARERTLSNLADALGDTNDLAVLAAQLRTSPAEFGGDRARVTLQLIGTVRDELVARCRPLGARLYAETEDHHRTRLRGYEKAYRDFGPERRVRELSKIFAEDEPAAPTA